MRDGADAVVVGGGVVGASIAFHLAAAGAGRVVLCEQYRLASRGATSRSGGLLRMHHTDPHEARLALLSLPVFAGWADRVGGDAGYRRTGFVLLVGPEHAEDLRANVAMLRSLGVPTEALEPSGLGRMLPDWSLEGVGAAAWEPDGGYADPALCALAFAGGAERRGAEVMEGVRVTGILADDGRIRGVETSAGPISTDWVVVATSGWRTPIPPEAGATVEVRPRHIGVCFLDASTVGAGSLRTCIDDTTGAYFRPHPGERILLGVSTEVADVDPDREPPVIGIEAMERARERLARRIPALAGARFAGARSGFDGYTPDRRALIGPAPGLAGLYLAIGFSGGGFKVAPAVGRAVAEEVLTGRCAPEVEAYRPDRFELGRAIVPDRPYVHL
jgi:sarcosine oxidase, subunit beta